MREGRVLRGHELTAEAERAQHRYAVCPRTDRLAAWPEHVRTAVRRGLAEVSSHAVPILSSEAWLRRCWHEYDPLDLLGDDVRAHVIAYVRPHVEVVNSGWWQWG